MRKKPIHLESNLHLVSIKCQWHQISFSLFIIILYFILVLLSVFCFLLLFFWWGLKTSLIHLILLQFFCSPTGHLTEYLESMEKIDHAISFFEKNNPDSIELSVLVSWHFLCCTRRKLRLP